jgi:uncharacterized protein (DUF1697 family)
VVRNISQLSSHPVVGFHQHVAFVQRQHQRHRAVRQFLEMFLADGLKLSRESRVFLLLFWRRHGPEDSTVRPPRSCFHNTPRNFSGNRLTQEGSRARPFLYNRPMALVVFLRGVNVGGHRTFRPSVLARELSDYGVVNVGAAGTFVVRKPGSRAQFRAALRRKLPFEAHVVFCDALDLIRLETENPFAAEHSRPDIVRFVSILSKADRGLACVPCAFPPCGQWFVRIISSKKRFVFGVYRRHMKTIGYLGQIDKLFGVPATTRNWNTVIAIVRILKDQSEGVTRKRP